MTLPSSPAAEPLPLKDKRIVLGVTGGIAAYKSIEVCRRLVDAGAHVIPILTDAALNMVGATTFLALASEPPKTSLWADSLPIPHTTLGQSADAIVVCPATARIISDLRTGRSADLLSATLIATEAPVIICPAMHTEMWEHPAVTENLAVLQARGVHIVPPEEGRLAGGDIGKGRLASPQVVFDAVMAAVGPTTGLLAGRNVLVTAGGTREPIDPVRFIGNRSSGRQGHAIATAALHAGANVTLITTADLEAPRGLQRVQVETAADLHKAVQSHAGSADVVIMAAAVADFSPGSVAEEKIKKDGGPPQVSLEPTVDILAELGEQKRRDELTALLVGFAAETQDLQGNAQRKLERKNADMIVANNVADPEVGFAYPTNAVTIYRRVGEPVSLSLRSKDEVARNLCQLIGEALAAQDEPVQH